MTQIISQGLTLPANVVTGGTIQASDVAALYATLNAFAVPDNVAALFQSSITTSTGTAVPLSTGSVTLTGGTSTAAVAQTLGFPSGVPANKMLFALGAYSWATTGLQLQLAFRLNGSTVATPPVISTSTSGSGLYFLVIGPHDATASGSLLGFQTGSTGAWTAFTASTSLPNAASTSFALVALFGTSTNGSTDSAVTWNFAEFWRRA